MGSDKRLTRRTDVLVWCNGVDISKHIKEHLLSMTYIDNEEDEVDDIQFVLEDRDSKWLNKWLEEILEATGASNKQIKVSIVQRNWNSDGKDASVNCGNFELDGVSAECPPSRIVIKATSLPFSKRIRQTKKDRAWEATSLSQVGATICSENGMKFMFESETDPPYDRVEQSKMSDIEFLSRLCHNAGLSLKATDSMIVIFDQSLYEKKKPVMEIKREANAYLHYSLDSGTAGRKYTSCRVSYTNPQTKEVIEGIAFENGDEEKDKTGQRLEITSKVNSIAEAKTLAGKMLRLKNKFEKVGTFSFIGNLYLAASQTISLKGFGIWDGKYIISQVRHTVGNNGYTTTIRVRNVLEGY